MKTDLQLQSDVAAELKWRPSTRDAEIGVAVKGGVVTLTGFVSSYAQKLSAERAAEDVAGVRALADELKVKLPTSSVRSDSDIAHSALHALIWNVDVPDARIKVKVENGWVTLEGDVDWRYEAAAAEDAVRSLMGVTGVSNQITVTLREPKISAFDVSKKIKDALQRSATVDSGRISVEAIEGKVVLKGTVRSWAERSDAERAAWMSPGVRLVEDQLAVSM